MIDMMIDIFNEFNRSYEPDDEPLDLRDILTHATLDTHRLDLLDDIAILRCDLDDELHHLTLIMIYERDSMTIRSFLAHSDTSTIMIENADDSDDN